MAIRQIKIDITDEESEKVDEIVRTYGFKTRYEVARALLSAFLKAYDPQGDEFINENLKEALI